MQASLCQVSTAYKRGIILQAAIPAWLPAPLAKVLVASQANSLPASALSYSGKKCKKSLINAIKPIKFSFSKGERKIFRKKTPIAVSLWAERHRVLTMSSIPGRWRNVFTPYLTEIMDIAGTSGVETVIICKTPQTGGSEAAHNVVGWCIDRAPGPVMYVFPDEITARENAKDRIIPMINNSPRLREYLTNYADDASSLRINLSHMPIYLGWSGSVARLGNKPIRTLILDELDKYKNPKNEASSEALAEKRTITWQNKKIIIKISTPTVETGAIWVALQEEAGAKFAYYVACSHCGMQQVMNLGQLTWPGKDTEAEIKAEEVKSKVLAQYICEHCGAVWDDNDRNLAVRRGEWLERSSGLNVKAHVALHKPIKVGFHIPAFLSYFVSLSEIAWAVLKYKESGKLDDLKALQNQYLAEPWQEDHASRSEDAILQLCDDRPRGAVPGAIISHNVGVQLPRISCILAGVDTQKSHFRYIIRAFGYGELEESWLIQAGIAPSFSALNEILWDATYLDPAGQAYKVRACMIDAMGGRTKEVYSWAIKNRGRVLPWQGVRSLSQPYSIAPQEYFPDIRGNKVKIPGGLNLWRCDTTFFKSDLSHKLSINVADPGAFHLHSNERGELEQYAKEMCAEVFDAEKMIWENPGRKDNHFWDCEVMALALAYIMNIRNLEHKPEPVVAAKSKQVQQVQQANSRLSLAERLGRR